MTSAPTNDSRPLTPPSTLFETPSSSAKRTFEPSASDSSRKRQKNGRTTYMKHPKFWALDGNTLLQIGVVRFKVHRSRLATQSPWFEKLFEMKSSLERPEAGGEKIDVDLDIDDADLKGVKAEQVDGHWLYYLDSTGVDVSDFETLLTAMDDGIDYYSDAPTFHTAAAILRSSTVFKFPRFRKFAVNYLAFLFPNDLEKLSATLIPNAAVAVFLGRHWDVPEILKRAFYELIRMPSLTHEHEDTSSTIDGGDKYAISEDEGEDEDDPILLLAPSDLVRLSNAQKHLFSKWLTAVALPTASTDCTASCSCRNVTSHWKVVHASGLMKKYEHDPLCGIQKLMSINWRAKGYCHACADYRQRCLKEQQELIWKELNGWLGLD